MNRYRKPISRPLTYSLAVALFQLSVPLATASAIAVLPFVTAAPAVAQDFPEEYDWPSNQSRLTGIKMPPRTIRSASGTTAYPKGVVERMVSIGKTAGMQVDRREEFFWSSLTTAQLKSERDIFNKNLTAAGYTIKAMGEEDHPDEHIIFFLAQKKGSPAGNGTVPGFWTVGTTFQGLIMGAAPGVLGPKVVPKVYTEKEKQGFALIEAVENKKVDEVKALLKKGVDPNSRSKYGQTPLMRAVMNDRPDLAEILLEAGADPNLGTKDMNPLQIAAMGQQVDLIEMLLQNKADINLATPEDGITALHVAAMLGKDKAVDMLLEKGADTTLRTKSDGRTAREMAMRNNHSEIAEKIRAAAEKGS